MDNQRHENFARQFVLSQARLYGYIVTLLPNRQDAEDVFQQTSLLLWQKWDEFIPDQPFLPWAYGFARNEVRNYLRAQARQGTLLSEGLLSELADTRETMQPTLDRRQVFLNDCLQKLAFMSRELVERCYRGRESMAIIARQFRTTPNALYLRLARIRRSLLSCIQQAESREEAP